MVVIEEIAKIKRKPGQPRLKMAGQKFNRLTVIEYVCVDGKGHTKWLCKCVCGKEKVILGDSLTTGKTKSCGCLQKEIMRNTKFAEKPTGVASFNNLYNRYRVQARRRRLLEFSIKKEDFKWLTKQDCHYCGIEPRQEASNSATNGSYYYNGLDRVDNQKGYTKENVVPCCKVCNRAKGEMTQKEFYIWIKRLKTFYEILHS